MKLLSLWIDEYRKYHNSLIVFNDNDEPSELQKNIFDKMNICLLSGENGTGKTTLMSFVALIFRYLQRFRERVPSDYKLVYEISHSRKNTHRITLEKTDKYCFITIDEERQYLMEYDLSSKKYRNNPNIKNIKQVTYDEIKKYLPSKVYVMGFDSAYSHLSYGSGYIGDKLVKYRDISKTYGTSSIGCDVSIGVVRFYEKYVTNNGFRKLINSLGFDLADYVDIYANIDYLEEDYCFPIWERYKFSENYKEGINKYFELKIDEYCERIESNTNERFNITDYFRIHKRDKTLEKLVESRNIYVNEFYLLKNNYLASISEMSTGEKSFLFDIFDLNTNIEDNSLLIWEEPETHMNEKWAKMLIPLISEMLKSYNSQWLISSHSSYLIKSLFQNQILCMTEEGATHPQINTFLANDVEIYKYLFKDYDQNPFEGTVLKLLSKQDNYEKIYNQLGESFLKLMIINMER